MSLELLGLPRRSLPYRSWPDRGIPGITGVVVTAIGYVRACIEFFVPSISMRLRLPGLEVAGYVPSIRVRQRMKCP